MQCTLKVAADMNCRNPQDHINIRILQNVISDIPLILGLGSPRMDVLQCSVALVAVSCLSCARLREPCSWQIEEAQRNHNLSSSGHTVGYAGFGILLASRILRIHRTVSSLGL